jgi:hypothetical protein
MQHPDEAEQDIHNTIFSGDIQRFSQYIKYLPNYIYRYWDDESIERIKTLSKDVREQMIQICEEHFKTNKRLNERSVKYFLNILK